MRSPKQPPRRRRITWPPLRIRRRPKVLAVQCHYCKRWVKPRYISWPAAVCRACERAGLNQTWKPSAAWLARAGNSSAEDQWRRLNSIESKRGNQP